VGRSVRAYSTMGNSFSGAAFSMRQPCKRGRGIAYVVTLPGTSDPVPAKAGLRSRAAKASVHGECLQVALIWRWPDALGRSRRSAPPPR
jgi:hypothetical protein